MIASNLIDLVGNTPILSLAQYASMNNVSASLYAKLEMFNPASSVKDRAALSMILDAESQGVLCPGAEIIEPTSGNTGVGLAWIAAVKGYKLTLTMPETMTVERRKLLAAYGANLVLTDGTLGMQGAIAKADELRAASPNAVTLGQFDNTANPLAHERTTGPEIWRDMQGDVDVFVAGVGTGGTLSGVGRYLKSQNAHVKIVAVEPAESPVLSKGTTGKHAIQGIGAGFVPANYDASVVDEILTVTTDDAKHATRLLAATEGVLVGVSSGAALCAATRLAMREEYRGKKIVVLLPDTGERYLSTDLF